MCGLQIKWRYKSKTYILVRDILASILKVLKTTNFTGKILCLPVALFIFSLNAFSQEDTSYINRLFETYNNKNYQEKVFLHTDKTVYASGEILWLKCYITDAATNKLSLLSGICYVEILSEDKKPLLQAKIDIGSGLGNGSFKIPSSIRTGNYIIRAYTNWMKNFDPSFYYEQIVTIINPNKKALLTKSDSASYSVNFFAEGGNLVSGLNNTVAFKLTDAYGKGLQGNGIIVNARNENVASFTTGHFGMGTFSFTPVKGEKYSAIIKVNNKTITSDLPKIYDEGWVMHVKDEGQTLLVTVASNINNEHRAFLFTQTKNLVKVAKIQTLNNGSANFIINKNDIGDGISQLTVLNENKQPVCERLYFKKPRQNLQISISNINKDYQPRNKVSFTISTNDTNNQIMDADISASVYLIDSLQPEQEINILNYLWLTSELKGPIESPQYYFENTGDDVDKAIDNLMLVNGWRRFKWEDVLKNTKPSFTFLPEIEGHNITGKLSPKTGGLPVNDIDTYLSVPGKYFKFSNSTSSAIGTIKFNVEKFYGSHEIIVQPGLKDSNYNISIDNPFSDKYNESRIAPLILNPLLSDNILLRTIGAQVQNNFHAGQTENFILPSPFDTTAFYGKPEVLYFLDNYTRFPTMEEVMREYVKEVRVKKRGNNFLFNILNLETKSFLNDDPLVLIDGVPVFNINKLMEIDPLKIRKAEIVTSKFFHGLQQYKGIVSYSTYDNDLNGYQLDPNSLVIEYDGLQLEREFYSPQYNTSAEQLSHVPDQRNVLYWSPDIKTVNGKQEISFYTSDIPGKYIVCIQGISTSGFAGFTISDFTISHK